MKQKGKNVSSFSHQLSISISHGKFYFISNCKSNVIFLNKFYQMNSHEATGKYTFFFIFNMLPQIPIHAEVFLFLFFPVHMILFSSDISFENSYICKGIPEYLA